MHFLRHFSVLRLRALRRRLTLSSLLTTLSLLTGCLASTPGGQIAPAPTTAPSASEPAGGWTQIANGAEIRTLNPGGRYPFTQFTVLRLDPARVTFRAHYRPGEPLTLAGWRAALPDAAGFINANFFDPQNNAVGLITTDGAQFGQSYFGRGGMFQVQNGTPRVRSLITEPYQGELLEQAVQAFPMLVTAGVPNYERTNGDRASRRTIVAQDTDGRILLIVTNSLFGMTLADLSQYLADSGLSIQNALNLDGGGSTMFALNGGESITIPSFDPVPAVLAFYLS
ncbi:MAG: phosphodiester glycosidase family protein [Pleurocapsa minor GSE-CHR-MK-17-07R]|nr:phosphodiester glycosidase family protein [Pleurocapsa minor GSE-CHR-MK 17-07R]